ncbi:endonuclease [Nostoc sp. 3335mG]|nr:endonuclease [Nostoc sp. 3335mG]
MLAAGLRWQAHAGERASNEAALSEPGTQPLASPMNQARFDGRQNSFAQAAILRAQGRLPVFIERKIGPTLDFMSGAPSDAARKAGKPVARIVSSVDPHLQAQGFASGFLVAPGLLLTNWHVFPDVASAARTGANFGYEQGDQGILLGSTFAIQAERFFVSDETLDFALVAVADTSTAGDRLDDLGMLVPSEAVAKILVGQPIEIIQYPDGGPKQWAIRNNRLIGILDEGFLHYETDTLEGSSGSPAFSEAWELVALHHGGVPEIKDGKIMATDGQPWTEDMGDDAVHWVSNEGIRMSAIVRALTKVQIADPAQAKILSDLLASTTDPADDINHVLNAPAVQPAAPDQPIGAESMPLPDTLPSSVAMTFTGPVTINIHGAPPALSDTPPVELAAEKTLRFDPDYHDREGYNPAFLGGGLVVPAPTVDPSRLAEMLQQDGQVTVLPYHHYSLAMNQARRLNMWTAMNADYDPASRAKGGRSSFGTDKWVLDPRIPAAAQMQEKDIYGPAGQVDRGHIVRREDNAWGATPDEIEFANSDTFHWTNCTPQHAAFNRPTPPTKQYQGTKGLWGQFEDYIQSNLQCGDTRACILAGPILAADDPKVDLGAGALQLPIDFWKVVVVADHDAGGASTLRAYGFILSQKDVVDRFGIEFAPGQYARYAKPLAEIAQRAGLVFDPILLQAEVADGFSDTPASG